MTADPDGNEIATNTINGNLNCRGAPGAPPWGSIKGPNGHFMVAVTLVEAGFATVAEWRDLIGRQAGFLNYDRETRTYCMITVPALWRDTPGPTWQPVAAMMRNQRRQFSEQPPPRPVQERLQLL